MCANVITMHDELGLVIKGVSALPSGSEGGGRRG